MKSPALLLPLLFVCAVSAMSIGCGKPEDKFAANSEQTDRVSRMNAQERAEIAPNVLFQSVLAGDLNAVQNAVAENAALLVTTNPKNGNTPLGLALELRERDIANYLAGQLTTSQYQHQNAAGESYVFLAAKLGYVEIIELLSDRYYNSFGDWVDWSFNDLDLPNKIGQKALHVAADRRTVEMLSTQYWRGTLEVPYWSFTLHVDNLGQTFLHTAAADGRADILLWGSEQFCDPTSWEKDGGWFGIKYVAGVVGSRATKIFQTYVGDFGAYVALLFNRADNDGKTAVHRAIEARNINAVRAVSTCRWLDYKLADNTGNIPLQTSLLQIPFQSLQTSAAEREIFNYVLNKDTALARWLYSRSSYWDSPNKEGQSAAHLAARLADPYFFETLASEANIYLKDNNGRTPSEIFEQRQSRVKLYAH